MFKSEWLILCSAAWPLKCVWCNICDAGFAESVFDVILHKSSTSTFGSAPDKILHSPACVAVKFN